MALKNKATLFGADGTPLYWSETTADATSYGTEAEVRKSLIDPNTGDSVETLDAVVDAEGNLVQNVYSYRVEFIPHGGFDNVAISDVEDVLPAETSFVGFVTAENAATAKNPVAGPISLNGNIEATYTEGVVKLVQKPGTKLQAGKPIEAYFAVKVNDKTAAPVINRIGNETEATIVPVASFNLSKTVVGAQQKNTAVPTTVDVTATWNEADESVSRVITVPTDGSATPFGINLPLGTEVTLTEAPLVDANGIAWGAPTWSGTGVTANDQGAATITIGEADNAGVKLENHAGNAFGSAKIEKKLEGGAAALVEADQEYVVTATIDAGDAQTTRAVNVRAGEPVPMDNLPVGATVTFSEVKPVDTDALTWATPVISPESITIESVQDEIPTITVTNSVERTVGTFSLTKTVAGEEAANSAVPESVEVTATWEQDGTPGSKVLKVPTDGTPVALGEKLLIGTKVTLTETAIADGSGIAWAAPSWGGTGVKIEANGDVTATIGHDAAAQVTLTNHAATSTGGISFIKQLTGDAVDAVPADTEFKVRASWDAGKGVESKDLTINTVTPTPLGEELPAGTVVTLTELERPEIAGVDWGSIVFSGEQVTPVDGESAQIFVSDQQGTTELLTVTNEATWSPGTFTISKQIEGIALDQAEVPATVTVQATWTDGADAKSRDIEIPTDGTPVPFGENLAYGTQVVLTETAVESSARMTWATPVWAVGEAEAQQNTSAEVIIGAATDTQVTLTNTAIATLGELSVSKLLTGSGTAEVPADAEFPVKATWSDLSGAVQERDLTVTTSTPAVITELPLGTEVSLSEGDLPDSATAKWLSAAWSSENDAVKVAADGIAATVTVTGDAGVSAAVALTNEYETGITPDPEDSNESIAPIDETTDPKDPKQDPKQGSNGSTEAPKQGQGNDLANTGSDMLAPLVGGGITLVLLGAGAVLLARRARKTA
nr:DUF5979 domain-containing protein [Leucobacter exalbidus]